MSRWVQSPSGPRNPQINKSVGAQRLELLARLRLHFLKVDSVPRTFLSLILRRQRGNRNLLQAQTYFLIFWALSAHARWQQPGSTSLVEFYRQLPSLHSHSFEIFRRREQDPESPPVARPFFCFSRSKLSPDSTLVLYRELYRFIVSPLEVSRAPPLPIVPSLEACGFYLLSHSTFSYLALASSGPCNLSSFYTARWMAWLFNLQAIGHSPLLLHLQFFWGRPDHHSLGEIFWSPQIPCGTLVILLGYLYFQISLWCPFFLSFRLRSSVLWSVVASKLYYARLKGISLVCTSKRVRLAIFSHFGFFKVKRCILDYLLSIDRKSILAFGCVALAASSANCSRSLGAERACNGDCGPSQFYTWSEVILPKIFF